VASPSSSAAAVTQKSSKNMVRGHHHRTAHLQRVEDLNTFAEQRVQNHLAVPDVRFQRCDHSGGVGRGCVDKHEIVVRRLRDGRISGDCVTHAREFVGECAAVGGPHPQARCVHY